MGHTAKKEANNNSDTSREINLFFNAGNNSSPV